MHHAYEILRDPTDRYVLWDLDDDAPVVAANRIVTFPAIPETRECLDLLRDARSEVVNQANDRASGDNVRHLPSRR